MSQSAATLPYIRVRRPVDLAVAELVRIGITRGWAAKSATLLLRTRLVVDPRLLRLLRARVSPAMLKRPTDLDARAGATLDGALTDLDDVESTRLAGDNAMTADHVADAEGAILGGPAVSMTGGEGPADPTSGLRAMRPDAAVDGDRAVLERAKGALMLRYGIGSHEALAVLAYWSQEADTELKIIAHTLVHDICQVGEAQEGHEPALAGWLERQLHRPTPEGI